MESLEGGEKEGKLQSSLWHVQSGFGEEREQGGGGENPSWWDFPQFLVERIRNERERVFAYIMGGCGRYHN